MAGFVNQNSSDYSQLVLIDSPLAEVLQVGCSNQDIDAHFLAALRHGFALPLTIPKEKPATPGKGIFSKKSAAEQSGKYTTYKSLLSFCKNFDVVAQQYILTALFERGFTVPLFIWTEPSVTLSTLPALWYTTQHKVNIPDDCSLMRVLVVGQKKSTTIKKLLGDLFKLESLLELDLDFTACDVGVGSIYAVDAEDKTCSEAKLKCKAIVYFCVGECEKVLREVYSKGLDLIIYELKELSQECFEEADDRLKSFETAQRFYVHHDIEQTDEENRCYPSEVGEDLRRAVSEVSEHPSNRTPLRSGSEEISEVGILVEMMAAAGSPLIERRNYYHQKNLQESFRLERLATQCISLKVRAKLENEKSQIYKKMAKEPLLGCTYLDIFIELLKTKDPKIRCLLYLVFQRHLEELNKKYFNDLHPEYKALVLKSDKSQNEKSQLDNLIAEETNCVLGIEHLWREISAMFSFGKCKSHNFSQLAAIHLLDGFTLDFIEGETSQINMDWFIAVMDEVKERIGPDRTSANAVVSDPRLFVLSVIGVESSGKSTLLNTMFGCRLRTSLLRCTKGINMQLVKCNGRPYDYVLLLDVEGVRSSKFAHIQDRFLHDNRLCTMAMLIADATIVMTTGNQMSDMASVLSMVRKASDQLGLEWKHPYFVERGINSSMNQERDREEFANHSLAKKNILVNSGVYKDFDFEFCLTPLPDNSHQETAVRYGIKVKALREMIKDRSSFLFEVKRQVKDVRDNILAVEKAFNHESNIDEVKAKEEERLFHSWRVEVDDVYKTIISDLQKYLPDIIATISKELESPKLGKRQVNAEWIAEYKNNTSFPEGLKASVENLLKVVGFIATLRSVKGPLVSEKEQLKALEKFVEYCTKDQIESLTNKFDEYKEFSESPRRETYHQRKQTVLETSRSRTQQYIEQMVTSRLHWHKVCEDAVADLVLFAKEKKKQGALPEKEWETAFDSEFTKILNKIHDDHPSIDVKANIENYFHENKVQQINITGEEKETDGNSSFWKKSWESFYRAVSGASKEQWLREREQLSQSINNAGAFLRGTKSSKMFSLAETVQHFEETKKKLDTFDKEHSSFPLHIKDRNLLFCTLMKYLIEYQSACHRLWEGENHPYYRFLKDKPRLFNVFKMILQGQNAVELAVNSISARFNEALDPTVEKNKTLPTTVEKMWVSKAFYHITKEVTDNSRNIYLNSTLFQAKADLDLIDRSDEDLGKFFRNSSLHYTAVLDICLLESLKLKKPDNVQALMISSLEAAAKELTDHIDKEKEKEKKMHEERLKAGQESKEEAKTESSGCLKVFFDALNRVLAEKGVDVNYSLTEAESLFKALDVAVWANTIPLCEVVDLIKTEAKIVSTPTPRNNACIEALKAQLCNEKVISDFRLRCDECCPMCGIQCDHPKGRGHDGLHQSFHQPDGLIGVKYHKTDILSEHSCITSAKFEYCIARDDKKLPYRKFNEAFPKWKDLDYNLESRATPLKVREYLFFHKQDLIHSLYPTAKRNENIHKCGYNHDITVLKAELRAVIKENMA